jgi:hypothetical protein
MDFNFDCFSDVEDIISAIFNPALPDPDGLQLPNAEGLQGQSTTSPSTSTSAEIAGGESPLSSLFSLVGNDADGRISSLDTGPKGEGEADTNANVDTVRLGILAPGKLHL